MIIVDRILLLLYGIRGFIRLGSILTIFIATISLFVLLKFNSLFLPNLLMAMEISNGLIQILNYVGDGYFVPLISAVMAMSCGCLGIYFNEYISDLGGYARIYEIMANGDSEYVIELEDVYKDYYVGEIVVHALRGISLKIKRGEFVAIMGPSGSGKSTLLNLIGALDRPTKGKIFIEGVDISKLDDNALAELRNRKIGFVFQMFNLITRTSVLRNVELPSIVSGMSKKERIERAKKLLRIMGLDDSAFKRRPVYLSGGQQQRVAIARALMNNPIIILADEPTGNLDSKTGEEVMRYLRMLNKEFNTTVIVVTHDRSVAEIADKIFHIRDGKIIREEVVNGRK